MTRDGAMPNPFPVRLLSRLVGWLCDVRESRVVSELPSDPEAEEYWNEPANLHWARHSSVYDDRSGGC